MEQLLAGLLEMCIHLSVEGAARRKTARRRVAWWAFFVTLVLSLIVIAILWPLPIATGWLVLVVLLVCGLVAWLTPLWVRAQRAWQYQAVMKRRREQQEIRVLMQKAGKASASRWNHEPW